MGQTDPTAAEAVAGYKRILRAVLENRPSGTRRRLAVALGKHRSFVTQIASPSYAVPIPARHLPTIFELCHFSAEDQRRFLAAYRQAHPGRTPAAPAAGAPRRLLPDLGDPARNQELEALVGDFVGRLARLLTSK
jgi:hypothetical protein